METMQQQAERLIDEKRAMLQELRTLQAAVVQWGRARGIPPWVRDEMQAVVARLDVLIRQVGGQS